ncbi:MAG: type II toxin-antitoxin system RelE/ParE family toxin [Bacteroidetes bacterium]|nr:type II toxin-antitoxin system RelE/ParE family toxin [Bacteroidota bacterium]
MISKVSYNDLADEELSETVDYYERQKQGLGISFLAEVERSAEIIQENPLAFPKIYRETRRKILQRFPYSIMYYVLPDKIRILAVVNHKRNPFYWRERK